MSLEHPTTTARAVFGIDDDEATDAGLAGHKAAKLARLTALKDTWDPGNVFHLNQNIPPTI